MATITGQGTTFDLPNYVGELFALTPTDTPFLSAIGGLNGGESVKATYANWQTYDLRTAAQNVALEGANAPTAQERTRSNVTNVAQIHQEVTEVSYTKMAATGQLQDINVAHSKVSGVDGMNPIGNELDWQVAQALKQIARDIEYSFINGTFQDPSTNATARQTRGILAAISTNVVSNAGSPFDRNDFYAALKLIYDAGGLEDNGSLTVIANSTQILALNDIFVEDMGAGFQQTSRNVGGVNLTQIITPFATLNVMMNRHMPTDQLAIVNLDQCRPFFVEIPGKGFMFAEPLAKVGAAERVQIYGEVGLKYGNELAHAKITGLPASFGYDS